MLASIFLAPFLCLQTPPEPAAPSADLAEFRGVVIGLDDAEVLASNTKIGEAMDFLYDHGFNVVFPVVWRQGVTLWPSDVMLKTCGVEVDPALFDPHFKSRDILFEIVVEAHRAGLEVVPILDLAPTSAEQGPGHALIEKHPAWAVRGKDGKPLVVDGAQRLDPRVPEVGTFLLDLARDLATFHEVDGLAWDENGLDFAADSKSLTAIGDHLQRVRAELTKIDPAMRTVLFGRKSSLAAQAWIERGLCDVFVPRLAARDIDGWKKALGELVALPWIAKDVARLAPFFSATDGTWRATAEYALAAIAHDREKLLKGEVFSSIAALRADKDALGDEIQREPYYATALLPWRNDVAWRQNSKVVVPSAGEGSWEWRTDSSGVRSIQLGGTQPGLATWTLSVIEKGDYDLYVWIPPDADVGTRANFSVSARGMLKSTVIDPSQPKFKGWVYIGTVSMQRREHREVARLLAEEKDPTKVTVAGPMVAVLHRRPTQR